MVREAFGVLPDGRRVDAFVLTNADLSVRILTLGGIVQSLLAPDRDGHAADVVLGFPQLDGYVNDPAFHGALVGRFANRIANGRFMLDGHEHRLSQNLGVDTLHGGAHGFNTAVWEVEDVSGARLALSHRSADGDQGFPGNLIVRAIYTLCADSALQIDFEAEVDAPTVINLTNHTYWNLAGSADVLDHRLQIGADTFTPADARLLPTGEIRPVEGSPFDFRTATRLRERVTDIGDPQIAIAGGIDHNFVVRHREPGDLAHAATLSDESTGRGLEVWTTEPGIQVYTGNSLGSGANGKLGSPYPRWSGVALETQHFPNSPNEPTFPSTVLRPGATFRSQTRFCLKTKVR